MARPNTFCCRHEDKPAVIRIVGEVDSFGAEINSFCQQCLDKINKEALPKERECQSCRTVSKDVKPHRDPSEGSTGRVYYWCTACWHDVVSDFIGDDDY